MSSPVQWSSFVVLIPFSKYHYNYCCSWSKICMICWGNFFSFVFAFSLTCYRVFFFFPLSGILLITLLLLRAVCKFRYSLLSRPFFLPVYVSISVTALVEVDFFPRWPWPPTLSSSAFGKQLRFHRFSLISFCSRLKVVFLYCNYYFFALCRNLRLWFVNSKNICWSWTCCFWNWPLPVHDKYTCTSSPSYFLISGYLLLAPHNLYSW